MDTLSLICSSLHDVGLVTSVLGGLVGGLLVMKLFKRRRFKLPPGPRGYPLVGNLFDLIGRKQNELFAELSQKYGPVISFYMGSQHFVVLNSLESALEAFIERRDDFGRFRSVSIDKSTDAQKTVAFSEGHVWSFQKKFAAQALRPLIVGDALDEKLSRATNNVFELLKTEKGPVNPVKYIRRIVTYVLCGVVWGDSYDMEDDEFTEFLLSDELHGDAGEGGIYLEDIFPLLRYWPTQKLQQFIRKEKGFHEIIARKVESLKKTFSPDKIRGLTDGLLLVKYQMDQKKNDGKAWNSEFTDQHILYAISDIFGAGLETTKDTLSFALRHMAAYPESQKKVQEEVDRVVGHNRIPNTSDKAKLCYTEAVINEVLRLYPAGPMALPYRTLCDTSIGGYDIPKGTGILFNIWHVHRDPKYWNEPNEFIPQRFLSDEGEKIVKPRSWLPFSTGQRSCLGKSLAQMEIVLLLATFLQTFSVRFVSEEQTDMDYELRKLVMRPKPYRLIFDVR